MEKDTKKDSFTINWDIEEILKGKSKNNQARQSQKIQKSQKVEKKETLIRQEIINTREEIEKGVGKSFCISLKTDIVEYMEKSARKSQSTLPDQCLDLIKTGLSLYQEDRSFANIINAVTSHTPDIDDSNAIHLGTVHFNQLPNGKLEMSIIEGFLDKETDTILAQRFKAKENLSPITPEEVVYRIIPVDEMNGCFKIIPIHKRSDWQQL